MFLYITTCFEVLRHLLEFSYLWYFEIRDRFEFPDYLPVSRKPQIQFKFILHSIIRKVSNIFVQNIKNINICVYLRVCFTSGLRRLKLSTLNFLFKPSGVTGKSWLNFRQGRIGLNEWNIFCYFQKHFISFCCLKLCLDKLQEIKRR